MLTARLAYKNTSLLHHSIISQLTGTSENIQPVKLLLKHFVRTVLNLKCHSNYNHFNMSSDYQRLPGAQMFSAN